MRGNRPLLGLCVLILAAAACASPAPVTPIPTPGPTPANASADGAAPDRVVVRDKPWLPPWSGRDTPPEIAERAGLRFCGVEEGPLFDVEIRQCFVDSVIAGRDIEFGRIEPTTEGDPIATIFSFEPPGRFSMALDSTQDKYGVPGWSVTFCDVMIPDPESVFELNGCVSGPTYP